RGTPGIRCIRGGGPRTRRPRRLRALRRAASKGIRRTARDGTGSRSWAPSSQKRSEYLLELPAAARDPRLHGADRQLEGKGDLFVAPFLQVAEDHRHPELGGEAAQRLGH